ncbi:MAG TPA: sulfite exporter TauE/SafE family protein [Methylomirabilota bacterium]|nr:sulfite exporter TauE/SafE family protein [Methylomirabilota bacterium]
MSPWELGLLVLSLGFAGLVKGVTGFGLPLFATPILAGLFGARQAVVIMSIPAFLSNLAVLYSCRRDLLVVRELSDVMIAGAVGVVVGDLLLATLDQNLLALVIAGVVLFFLARADRLLGNNPRTHGVKLMGPLIGGLSGLLLGGTSIAGPLLALYLHSKRLPPREFVASLTVVIQVFATVQLIGFWQLGLYNRSSVAVGLLSLLPALLAVAIGVRVRGRVNTETFRTVISVLLALSAINLIVQGLRGFGVFS